MIIDWRVREFPVQVRIRSLTNGGWDLYSRHREMGKAAQRAFVEAKNVYPRQSVALVDTRKVVPAP